MTGFLGALTSPLSRLASIPSGLASGVSYLYNSRPVQAVQNGAAWGVDRVYNSTPVQALQGRAINTAKAVYESRVGQAGQRMALRALNTRVGEVAQKGAIAVGKRWAGLTKFERELPGRIKQHSEGLSPPRIEAAKLVSQFVTQTILHEIQNSKKVEGKPEWTDFFHEHPVLGPKVTKVVKEHEKLATDAIALNILKGIKQFSEHLKGKPELMENLGTDLLEIASQQLDSIHDFNTKEFDPKSAKSHDDQMLEADRAENAELYPADPKGKKETVEHFYKQLTEQLLNVIFPNGAKDLELPSFFDKTWFLGKKTQQVLDMDRNKLWLLLKDKILPDIVQKIFSEITSRDTINKIFLKALEELTEPKAASGKPAFVVPQDALQDRLNNLSGKLIESFLKNVPETLAEKIMGNSFLKNQIIKYVGGMLREQLKEWDLTKIMDVGILNGLQELHHGQWSDDKTTFTPILIKRDKDGIPLKDEKGNVIPDKPGCKFWFPTTDAQKKKHATAKTLEAAKVEHKLERKIDDMLKNHKLGTFGMAMAKPEHFFLSLLTAIAKAFAFIGCILCLGIPFYVIGWSKISNTITDVLLEAQRTQLVKQRQRVMKLVHEPVFPTLFRRVAKTAAEALNKK